MKVSKVLDTITQEKPLPTAKRFVKIMPLLSGPRQGKFSLGADFFFDDVSNQHEIGEMT